MKKTYLKPAVTSMVFVTDNVMQITSGEPITGGETGGGRPKPGTANEQEGNWDNIWK